MKDHAFTFLFSLDASCYFLFLSFAHSNTHDTRGCSPMHVAVVIGLAQTLRQMRDDRGHEIQQLNSYKRKKNPAVKVGSARSTTLATLQDIVQMRSHLGRIDRCCFVLKTTHGLALVCLSWEAFLSSYLHSICLISAQPSLLTRMSTE